MMTPVEARPVVGVVLAGGRARRMGGKDKSFLLLDGEPLLHHAIARLAPQVAALVVSANGPADQFARFGVATVADTISGFAGPLAGFLAGMAWARANLPGASHIATVAVDTPFFPSDLVARLSGAGGEGVAVAGSRGRIHPVFALIPVGLADNLAVVLAAGESLKVADWLARQNAVTVDFDKDSGVVDPLFNINTPDDLAQAEAIIHRLRQSVS